MLYDATALLPPKAKAGLKTLEYPWTMKACVNKSWRNAIPCTSILKISKAIQDIRNEF